MKKSTPLITKKISSNTSKGAQRKLKHTWKSKNYPAGLKHIEDKSGEWHGESLPCPKIGTEESSIGILDWTRASEQEDKLENPKEDGKMTSNEFMKTEEGHEKERYDLKNNNSWMKEI